MRLITKTTLRRPTCWKIKSKHLQIPDEITIYISQGSSMQHFLLTPWDPTEFVKHFFSS